MTPSDPQRGDVDRQSLLRCCRGLMIKKRAIQRDEGGLWCVIGKHGSITPFGRNTDTNRFQMFAMLETRQQWRWAQVRLAGLPLALSTETEGVYRFALPVSEDIAATVRSIIGLPKAYTDAELAARRERALARGLGGFGQHKNEGVPGGL